MEAPASFPGAAGLALTAMQLLVALTSYGTEINPKTRATYSKFAKVDVDGGDSSKTKTWPSRLAMMVIYTPALLVAAAVCLGFSVGSGLLSSLPGPSAASFLMAAHFGKRCLEVMLLHRYSGRTDRGTPTMIGFYYALTSLLICACGDRTGETSGGPPSSLGKALFCVGLAGNFYHHRLLAGLRSGDGGGGTKRRYVPPRGGMFSLVAAPHYLFELAGWLGAATVVHHVNAYLVVLSMTSYLAGRSVAQNEFNRLKFDEGEWPRSRRNLVPFLF